MMTNKPTTDKQRRELVLLYSLRLACFMARAPELMDDERVQSKLEAINHYLKYNHPSQPFDSHYCQTYGNLGEFFKLHINANNIAKVYRADLPNNVIMLEAHHA